MSRLSVRNTIANIFSTYGKNFFILAPFGIIVAVVSFAAKHFQEIINAYYLTSHTTPTVSTITQEATSTGSAIGNIVSQIKQKSVFFNNMHKLDYTFFSLITFIILVAISYYIYFSFLKILINLPNNQHPRLKNLFMYDCSIFRAFAASLVHILLIGATIGLITGTLGALYLLLKSFFNINSLIVSYKIMIPLLILLACSVMSTIFYIATRFSYAVPFVLDKNNTIKDAFINSWYLTQGLVFKISIVYALTLLLSLVTTLLITTFCIALLKISTTSPLLITLYALISGVISTPLIGLTLIKTYQETLKSN
ncbi:hypothetical protein EBU24_03370 [bacterium]|nr:hypothetical protein [bacterium]